MKDRWIRMTALLVGGVAGWWGGGLLIGRFPWSPVQAWANWRGQVLAAFLGAGLAVIFVPWLVRQLSEGLRLLLAGVQRIPMRDMVYGVAGLIAGLLVALLVTAALPPIRWVGPYLRLVVTLLAGYLGLMIALRKKDEGLPLSGGHARTSPGSASAGIGSGKAKGGAAARTAAGPQVAVEAAEETTWAPTDLAQIQLQAHTQAHGVQTSLLSADSPEAARSPAVGPRASNGSAPGATAVGGGVPKLLDTSAIIDGRIADVAATGFLEGPLVVPGFVIAELQRLADSADLLKRNRGRRGLDLLAQMRQELPVEVIILEDIPDGANDVDLELVRLARHLGARVVTTDYNLNKVARLHGVGVLNLNDLANAVKPVVLPGEEMEVRILRDGKEQGQGVGYLDDGTMIVVDGGREYVGRPVMVCVTSVLQTSAGRMIFARPKSSSEKVGQASNA